MRDNLDGRCHYRWFARVAILVSLVLVTTLPQFAQAMQPSGQATSYKAELVDWEVRISGPNFALENVALEEYPHGRGERIYVSSVDSLAFAEIAFFDDADTPEQTIAVMLSEFESTSQSFRILDEGVFDGTTYALASFQLSAEYSGYFYIEVALDVVGNVDVAQSLYTINEDFGAQLSLARSEVTIAGNSFLGQTATDLESQVLADQRAADATAAATPAQSGYTFQKAPGELRALPPVTFDYPLNTEELEAAYISSPIGFGFIGYMSLEVEGSRNVIEAIIADAPTGASAPELLHMQDSGEHTWGVYRIAIDDDVTIMVIDVNRVDADLWQVEALAVRESEFLAQFVVFQQSVQMNGTPFLDSLAVDEIDEILTTNQP